MPFRPSEGLGSAGVALCAEIHMSGSCAPPRRIAIASCGVLRVSARGWSEYAALPSCRKFYLGHRLEERLHVNLTEHSTTPS